ncbi:kelch domain-containing protein 10 homolog [Drosophila bipectinata]|uniref:kelch domain-containing protein 10 homolog n=1 Tax=Drosophila bipectinata TaxID=42026 RepID=UPI001C89E1A6|nr:kelch domain-containing protein 10 homolog [Drosophila bipectinata]
MNILKPSKLKCIVLNQLRHTWTFLLFVVDLLQCIIRAPQPTNNQEPLNIFNNNNNNDLIMDQDLPEEGLGQPGDQPPQPQQPQPQQEQQNMQVEGQEIVPFDPRDFVARIHAIAGAAEPMDAASDIDEEEEEDDEDVDVDYGDTDSDSEFEEMYSDESTSSDELEEQKQISKQLDVFLGQHPSESQGQLLVKPQYAFQPLRLVKCQFRNKHFPGGFPLARSGHRIIASSSHLYSLGGYNPRSALVASRRGRCLLFQELWSFNFATSTWKLELNADNASNMPVELASNALTIHNNVLISHGGTGYPFGESCSNDCYVYRTNSGGSKAGVERLKVTGDLPTAQYGPGIVIHKHYLYTIGGTTGFDYTCDVYRLDLRTRIWENVYISRPEMRDDPDGRYRHEVVYDGKHIYVLGGGTSHSVYDLQRIPAYNLEANCWDYFDTQPDRSAFDMDDGNRGYPRPRKCFSCVQHESSNGDIEAFITGGLQGDFSTYFSDIWKLNLRTKQWFRIITASLPRPLYFHSAAHSDNGCMYVFGGIEYNDKEMRRRNDLYKMWMTVPKLSEMCWDAITYYNDNLDTYDRKALVGYGIPKRFVDRLPPHRRRRLNRSGTVIQDPSMMISLYSNPKRARSTTQ